jgi:hypothetical protein
MELDFTSHIYPADSILRAVHLVALPGYPDWKPSKLLDLEFANSIRPTEGTPSTSCGWAHGGSDEGVSKRGDHHFSQWRPKQLEPDCAELTSSIRHG